MAGKSTDRKGKSKDNRSLSATGSQATGLAVAEFKLPESLPCSEVEFPVLIKRRTPASWNHIIEEREEWQHQMEEYAKSKKPCPIKSPFLSTECDYIQNEIFVHLLPAIIETLRKAKIWDAFTRHKCFFNGVDNIVQELWNNNPRNAERKENKLHVFNMPWVRELLKKTPRPYYPKSWLWPEEYAATLIQKSVRQYFVQKQEEVQEMRDFWKKLEIERHVPEMNTNPFLSKLFATSMQVTKTAAKDLNN